MPMKKRYTPGLIKEEVVERYLVKSIERIGGQCIKGNPKNQRGMPDRICILPSGLIIFVEVKRPGRKLSPNQRVMINRFRKLGHEAVWVNSFGMIDRLINWAAGRMISHKVVGTDYICHRPNCRERVKETWAKHLEKLNSSTT